MGNTGTALLEVPGLVDMTADETKKTNGGLGVFVPIVAAFAVGYAIGTCIADALGL